MSPCRWNWPPHPAPKPAPAPPKPSPPSASATGSTRVRAGCRAAWPCAPPSPGALVTEPDLLLLDEPFAALDSVTRRRLIEDLHRLWAARPLRPAIVFVTHDVEEAVYLAGRTLVLDGATGRVTAALVSPGVLPRPEGWRADVGYRAAVERLAAELAGGMAPFPPLGEKGS